MSSKPSALTAAASKNGGFERVLYVGAVRSGKTPAVTGSEGVASVEIAIKCLEAPSSSIVPPVRTVPRRIVG